MNWKFWKDTTAISQILAEPRNREEFLGVKEMELPTPKDIRDNAAKIATYSNSADYKRFADETWARIVTSLDKILDERSSNEVRQHNCGQVKAMLDLLRLSYQARMLVDEFDKSHSGQQVPSRP